MPCILTQPHGFKSHQEGWQNEGLGTWGMKWKREKSLPFDSKKKEWGRPRATLERKERSLRLGYCCFKSWGRNREKKEEERKVLLEFSRELSFFLSVHRVPTLFSKVVNPCLWSWIWKIFLINLWLWFFFLLSMMYMMNFFACSKIYTCAYTLMCMSCMVHNLHDLYLNMCTFLCDLHELYYVNVSLCLYGLVSHSL